MSIYDGLLKSLGVDEDDLYESETGFEEWELLQPLTPPFDMSLCIDMIAVVLNERTGDASDLLRATIELSPEPESHFVVGLGHIDGRFVPKSKFVAQTIVCQNNFTILEMFRVKVEMVEGGSTIYKISGYGELAEMWGNEFTPLMKKETEDKMIQLLTSKDVWELSTENQCEHIVSFDLA